MVVLAHINGAEEQAILGTVPDVAVSIAGRIHEGLSEAQTHDGRVLVRMKCYGEDLGRLDLQVDTGTRKIADWKWKQIPVDPAKIEPAADVLSTITKWEAQVKELVDRPLAVSQRAFTENEVRTLIERAMREQTGADFAFMNAGSIRDSLPKGQLLERHIWNIMPFDYSIITGTFKGKDLPAVVLDGRTVEPERGLLWR